MKNKFKIILPVFIVLIVMSIFMNAGFLFADYEELYVDDDISINLKEYPGNGEENFEDVMYMDNLDSYVCNYYSNVPESDLYSLDDTNLGGSFMGISLYSWILVYDALGSTARMFINVNNINYYSDYLNIVNVNTIEQYSFNYNINPNTDLDWVLQEINDLKVGIELTESQNGAIVCTQLNVVVYDDVEETIPETTMQNGDYSSQLNVLISQNEDIKGSLSSSDISSFYSDFVSINEKLTYMFILIGVFVGFIVVYVIVKGFFSNVSNRNNN